MVLREFPEAEFRICGPLDSGPDGISKGELNELIVDGAVTYIGPVKDVRYEIQNCSVYVLPSYREGTPRTVLEAMAMGIPIITTDVPGCRQTVDEGVNGYLVPPQDPIALANACIKFLKRPSLGLEMGLAARRVVEKRYDVRRVNSDMFLALQLMRGGRAYSG